YLARCYHGPVLAVWIVVAIVGVLVLWAIYGFNRLVRLRVRVQGAWSQIDVQLRRRYDLIPNLVEAVKGYAAHEREVFEEVTRARRFQPRQFFEIDEPAGRPVSVEFQQR